MSRAELLAEPPVRPPRQPPPEGLVLVAFLSIYLIWGSTYLGIRIAIESIPPLLMAGSRFLIAGFLLFAVMRARGVPKPVALEWRSATIIGALLLLCGNGGVSWAELTVPSNVAALLIAATPLWILFLDWLRPGGRRPHAFVFVGLGLGFAGVALIVTARSPLGTGLVDLRGALVLLGASLCWATGSLYSRHAPQNASSLLNVAMQMIAGGLLLILAGSLRGEWQGFDGRHISAASLEAFLYLTFAGSLIGFTAYVWLLQVSTPARVSTYAYINPLVAVILGRVFLAETLPPSALLAAAMILCAVVIITLVNSRAKAPARA